MSSPLSHRWSLHQSGEVQWSLLCFVFFGAMGPTELTFSQYWWKGPYSDLLQSMLMFILIYMFPDRPTQSHYVFY